MTHEPAFRTYPRLQVEHRYVFEHALQLDGHYWHVFEELIKLYPDKQVEHEEEEVQTEHPAEHCVHKLLLVELTT